MTKDDSFAKRRAFFWTISDWKYMIKEPTLKYLLETGIIGDYIDQFTKISMIDAIENRSQHILFSSEGYFLESMDYHYLSLKIAFILFKEINTSDNKFNQETAHRFYKSILSIEDQWEEYQPYKGFVEVPVLRIFSLWITRYLLNNLVKWDEGLKVDSIKDIQAYRGILKKLMMELFEGLISEELEHFYRLISKILGRVIGFCDEIRSQKWVNLGLEITAIPKIVGENLGYYFSDPDTVLFQILLIVTDNPSLYFKAFMEGYSIDRHISSIYTGMIFDPSEYKLNVKDNIHKDVSNLKYLLYFLNGLMVDDRTILYQWRPYREFQINGVDQNLSKRIGELFEKAAKYEAIHTLIRESGSSIKVILSKAPKQMADSEEFERALNLYSRCTTNREGKKIFSIDPKHMSSFNSFWYRNLTEHSEAMKKYEEFYKPQDSKESKKKSEESNPLNITNSILGFFLGGIRESIISTEIP